MKRFIRLSLEVTFCETNRWCGKILFIAAARNLNIYLHLERW